MDNFLELPNLSNKSTFSKVLSPDLGQIVCQSFVPSMSQIGGAQISVINTVTTQLSVQFNISEMDIENFQVMKLFFTVL